MTIDDGLRFISDKFYNVHNEREGGPPLIVVMVDQAAAETVGCCHLGWRVAPLASEGVEYCINNTLQRRESDPRRYNELPLLDKHYFEHVSMKMGYPYSGCYSIVYLPKSEFLPLSGSCEQLSSRLKYDKNALEVIWPRFGGMGGDSWHVNPGGLWYAAVAAAGLRSLDGITYNTRTDPLNESLYFDIDIARRGAKFDWWEAQSAAWALTVDDFAMASVELMERLWGRGAHSILLPHQESTSSPPTGEPASGQQDNAAEVSLVGAIDAAAINFTGKRRRVLDLLVERGGRIALSDLATDSRIDWTPPYHKPWDDIRGAINKRLRELGSPLELSTNNGHAIAHLKVTPGTPALPR